MSSFSSDTNNLVVNHNSDGWGPSSGDSLGINFYNMPYSHFDKRERCTKAADFADKYGKQGFRRRDDFNTQNSEFGYTANEGGVGEESSSFNLVDTSKSQTRSRYIGRRPWGQSVMGRGMGRGRFDPNANAQMSSSFGGRGAIGGRGRGTFGGRMRGRAQYRGRDRKMDRLPSIMVEADWNVVQELDFADLVKLQTNTPVMKDIMLCGKLECYDDNFDKVTAKSSVKLSNYDDTIFYDVKSSEDPVLEKLFLEDAGNVFASDSVLSLIMTAPRSVYSWDLLIHKVDGKLFIEKRDDFPDTPTVSETSNEQHGETLDSYNQADNLSNEAFVIKQRFSQQVLKPGESKTEDTATKEKYDPNPFFQDDGSDTNAASVLYRYRKYALGSLNVISRCEIHGWTSKRNKDVYHTTFALNEWDSKFSGGTDWRNKIDAQRSSIFTTELKINSCKIARWTAESILSGADEMKVGYVSRTNPKNPTDHEILAVQSFKPIDLAYQISLKQVNMWGILKMICDLILNQEDGKYLIMKDPNKSILRIYSIPNDALE